MAIQGTVVHPLSGLSPIVGELIAERMSQLAAYRAAQIAAPIVGRRARNGTYVSDSTFRGLNLQTAPNVATAGSLYATQYPSQGVAYGTGTFEIARYLVDQQDVPDAVLAEWAEVAGISVESRVADLLAERVAAFHSYKAWAAIGTSGSYTSGYAADPGNITLASFKLISLCQTVSEALIKSQVWTPGEPIDVLYSYDLTRYIQSLNEVRARLVSGGATNTIITPGMISDWFAAYLPGATATPVTSYHVATNGTVTADFSGKILFSPRRDAWRSAWATIAPQGDGSGVSVASVRSERVEAMPGTRLYADGHMDLKLLNPSGAYLAYDLLS